jgi:hypothetical protein
LFVPANFFRPVCQTQSLKTNVKNISSQNALLKPFMTVLVWLTPEGVGEHLEGGFGQQLTRFA